MNLWTIEPRDTLVLRDGRPMRGDGLQMPSLPLPFPSAIAGFFRTRSAMDEHGRFVHAGDQSDCDALKKLPVCGPWLGMVEGGRLEHLFHAPGDALCLETDRPGSVKIIRLGTPEGASLRKGEATDLSTQHGLELVFPSERVIQKPTGGPSLWRWKTFRRWLLDATALQGVHELSAIGPSLPGSEPRTNVKIDGQNFTGVDGQLFSVEHRRYQAMVGDEHRLSSVRRMVLVAGCDAASIRAGTMPFAGERRLVHLKRAVSDGLDPPEEIVEGVARSGRARVVLLTPAVFESGWRPRRLLEADNIKIQLRAARVSRPVVVSGWDMAKSRPKPTRRLAPAGSVYYLDFEGDRVAIAKWVRAHWWTAISDNEQARRDGFGLAAIGLDAPISGEVQS